MEQLLIYLAVAVVGVFFTIIGFLLVRRDSQQQKLIDDLYHKYHLTETNIVNMKLDLAKNFHPKNEVQQLLTDFKQYLDGRFERLETAFSKHIERREYERDPSKDR